MEQHVAIRIILPLNMDLANGVALTLNRDQMKVLRFLSLYYPPHGLTHDEMTSVIRASSPHSSASQFQNAVDEISRQIGHIIDQPQSGKPFSLIAWDGSFYKLAPNVNLRRIEQQKYIWVHPPVAAVHPSLPTRYGMTVNGTGYELTENEYRFLRIMAPAAQKGEAVPAEDLLLTLTQDREIKPVSSNEGPLGVAFRILNEAVKGLATSVYSSPFKFSGIMHLESNGYALSPDIFVELEETR